LEYVNGMPVCRCTNSTNWRRVISGNVVSSITPPLGSRTSPKHGEAMDDNLDYNDVLGYTQKCPNFWSTRPSADQRPRIIHSTVEVDSAFVTKPRGKWGSTILTASHNAPWGVFFCSPSLPPWSFAACLSFRMKTRNLGFSTVPGRLPLRCARGRGSSVSSPVHSKNLSIFCSIAAVSFGRFHQNWDSTSPPRPSGPTFLHSSSRSGWSGLAALNASVARESIWF